MSIVAETIDAPALLIIPVAKFYDGNDEIMVVDRCRFFDSVGVMVVSINNIAGDPLIGGCI